MNPLTLFSGPYALIARLAVVAIVAAALFAFGWVRGDEHGTEKLVEYVGKQATADVKLAAAREVVKTVIQTKYVDHINTIYVKGDAIIQKVTEYVTKTDDAGCTVPVGFLREFNAAWSGAPAGPPVESDRGPSGIPLSGVAQTDAGNATSCLVYKAQRDGLIELYRKLQTTQ